MYEIFFHTILQLIYNKHFNYKFQSNSERPYTYNFYFIGHLINNQSKDFGLKMFAGSIQKYLFNFDTHCYLIITYLLLISCIFPCQITLNDLIPPKMPFFRGNDIFQHWQIGVKRLGLAFNGTADARSFDRGIRVALENIGRGF